MSDYCEWPEFYSEVHDVARKEHRCVECRRAIPIGTKYVRCTGKFDGEFFADNQHEECWTFARKINLDLIGECVIPFGGVDDALQAGQDDFFLGDEIAPEVIDQLRAEWSQIKTLYPEIAA